MSSPDYSNKRFLVVDDFENFRSSIKRMLTDMGAKTVDLAINGKEAILCCSRNDYDYLLLDYNLGKGKNGQQVLEQLRVQKLVKRKCVVLMCTAEIEQEMVVCAAEHQPDSYLAKPFTFMLLQSRLKKLAARAEVLAPVFSALDNEDLDSVIAHCEQQIGENSRYNKWCRKTKAEALLKTQKLLEAEAIYREELEEKPTEWALLGLGSVFNANNQTDKALTCFKEAISNNRMCLSAYDETACILEDQGEFEQAQQVLQTAVKLSPRSVTRVAHLGNVAEDNGDSASALTCFKIAHRLAPNSIHHSAQHSLKLARCLTESSLELSTSDAKKAAKEALRVLSDFKKEFSDEKDSVEASLAAACAHFSLGDEKTAQANLEQAKFVAKNQGIDDQNYKLALAQTLGHMKEDEQAHDLLLALHYNNPEDKTLLRKIDRISVTSITEGGDKKIMQLSKAAVNAYGNKEFDLAVDIYYKLCRQYPKHFGVRLNLIQACLASLSSEESNEDYFDMCEASFNALGTVANSHEKFQRYNMIRSKYSSLCKKSNRPVL